MGLTARSRPLLPPQAPAAPGTALDTRLRSAVLWYAPGRSFASAGSRWGSRASSSSGGWHSLDREHGISESFAGWGFRLGGARRESQRYAFDEGEGVGVWFDDGGGREVP